MVPLEVRNNFCTLPKTAPTWLIKEMLQATAYLVEGHEMSKAFRAKYWDGREHLMKYDKAAGVWTFPTGLLADIAKLECWTSLQPIDLRKQPDTRRVFTWHGFAPRDYQEEAVEAALAERGMLTGKGMINQPIRTGKTLVAARLIQKTGLRTVFVVPSKMLMHQTAESFRRDLGPDAPIGLFGDGELSPNYITVATFQTFLAHPKLATLLLGAADLLIVDEGHHLEAPEWRRFIVEADCFYKLALSATLYVNKDIPSERGSIWLKGCTGPILYKVSMQRMFDAGHLVPPHIWVYPITQPMDFSRYSYATAYEKCVATSRYRNSAIADLTEQAVMAGLRVLIDTGRHDQMRSITAMLKSRHIAYAEMTGKTPTPRRKELLDRFRENKVGCLIGTVLGEGIDIPELEVVINAEGMKSKKAVIQRMRNLTPSEGKRAATFIDFADTTHPRLREHSLQRLKMYQGIRGFKVHQGPIVDGQFRLKLPPA